MRAALITFLSILLILSACEKEDEVLPTPPTSQDPPSVTVPKAPQDEDPAADPDSAFYRYGKFSTMPYRILIPKDYDSSKKYPLHLFLHGLGESGTDNERQLSVGASYFLADSIRENYPSFIIFPQCPTKYYWFEESATEVLEGLIDTIQTIYAINKQQISIGGFSMGAFGTFAMVARNPGLFEAAIAISGDGDERKASAMAKPRWRIFAGKKDKIVSSTKTEQMAKALRKAGAAVTFTLYPNTDHGHTWMRAFSEPDYFYWLFSPKKTKAKGPTNN